MRLIHFRDPRPPHEIQFLLERELVTLLAPVPDSEGFALRGQWREGWLTFTVELRFEAALFLTNAYSLRLEAAWPVRPGVDDASTRKSCDGWFDFWTRHFKSMPPTLPGEGSAERYERIARQARAAEAHLTGVAEIQREIVAGLEAGGTFSTAHKEGGTVIRYQGGRYVRADYGEWSGQESFEDEARFLDFLRRFYDHEVSRHVYPEAVPEAVAWKLILRKLERGAR